MDVPFLRYPAEVPEDDTLDLCMILDDSYIITNIKNDETVTITLPPSERMRPVPPARKDKPTKVNYRAQNICDKPAFKTFYLARLGKSVKMNFEGHVYYGYLSDLVIGEEDVTFSYTHTSKIPELEEDRFF